MRICYVFASRQRRARFFAALDNIREMSASKDYFVIAKLDLDDPHMTSPEAIEHLQQYPEVEVKWGNSKSKIDAINRGLEDLPPCDIIICMSDDMVFIQKGFDEIIRENMPDDRDHLLHFPDSYAKSDVCTMSIMGIDFYRRFGYMYHPDYISLWCDNELTDVAKSLNRYKFIDQQILDHNHYSNGRVKKDSLYKRNDTYRHDEQTYLRRKEKNFDLP